MKTVILIVGKDIIMEMTEKYMARWEALRGGGRKRFIWKRCVLSLMLPFSIFLAICSLVDYSSLGMIERILLAAMPVVIAGLGGGYLLGCMIWSIMERKYLITKQEQVQSLDT